VPDFGFFVFPLLFRLLPVIEFSSIYPKEEKSQNFPFSATPQAIEIISSGGDKINDYGSSPKSVE